MDRHLQCLAASSKPGSCWQNSNPSACRATKRRRLCVACSN
jgi:hypothetical protein